MKRLLIITLSIFTLIAPGLFIQPAYADCPGNPTTSQSQALEGLGATGSNCSDSGVGNIVSAAIGIISFIAGIAAVIMLILSGFRYITSGGDSGKVSAAKNALIYALVGVAVVALSQFLVHFVLTAATTAPCPAGHHRSLDGKECIKD